MLTFVLNLHGGLNNYKDVKKSVVLLVAVVLLFSLVLTACTGSSSKSYSSGSSKSYGSSSSSSSTTRNGYDMPKSGENFSDYVKRVDPDLYSSMENRYNTAIKNGW